MEPAAEAYFRPSDDPPSSSTSAAPAGAVVPPPAAPSETSLESAAQLSAASGSLATPSSGCSTKEVPAPSRSVSRFAADASRSPSMRPVPESGGAEPAIEPSLPSSAEAAAAEPDHAEAAAEEAPAAPAAAVAEVGADVAAEASGGSTHVAGSEAPAMHAAPSEEQQAAAAACAPSDAADAAAAEASNEASGSTVQEDSDTSKASSGGRSSSCGSAEASSSPVAASPSRLSVAQLLKARELAAAAAAASGGGPPTSAPSSACSLGRHSLASSPSQARLASGRSSPSLSARCRSPRSPWGGAAPSAGSRPATAASGCTGASSRPGSKAASAAGAGSRPGTACAEASGASSTGSRGGLASGHSTLLQPTASYVAGVEQTRSRKEQRRLASRPSAHQPQATTPAPFKLSCDERAQSDYTRSSDAFKLTREEREAAEVEKGRQRLAAELSAAKERCRRTLSVTPQRPARAAPHQPEFQEFALQSVARHAAYAQKFAEKVAEEQRREDELHGSPSHGSRPSSRIGALHGPSAGGSAGSSPSVGSPAGGSPPLLATGERAARHAELSAERRRREEAEAASKEAERLAALSVAEREEEAERAAHRFKARPMPDFARPVFSPDKRKAKPATTVREFKFCSSARGSAPAASAAGAAQDPPSRSGSRLRNEGSAASL